VSLETNKNTNLEEVFMFNKALHSTTGFARALPDWGLRLVHIMWAIIPIKSIASGFTLHLKNPLRL